jgi:hypothetical protein
MFFKKKKEEVPKRIDKKAELLKYNQAEKDSLIINRTASIVDISGKSITEDDRESWVSFLESIERDITMLKTLTINCKVDLYNTSQGQYTTKLFQILSSDARCRCVVNWFYFEGDDYMEEYGDIHKQRNPKVEVNLIERND